MSDVVHEPARDLEVIDQADVVVLGGGPAGVAAAVAARRAGAGDVLLIERYGCLGGLSTGGNILILVTLGPKGRTLMSGLPVELVERLRARDALLTHDYREHEEPVFDPEWLKFVSLELCQESGVRLLFHAWAAGAVTRSDRMEAVILESKSGRQAVRARHFVDATGDGDTAAWCDVPHENTESPLGLGFSWRFGNLDFDRFHQFVCDQPEQMEALRGEMREAGVVAWITEGNRPDWGFVMTYTPGDALSVQDLSRTEIEQRRLAVKTYDFYRANVPGFERASLMDTASQVGTRESRRILGEYQLTADDTPGGRFDDSIGTGVCWRGKTASQPFDIPYRALVPRGMNNLLYAGRCISANHDAHQETRVIPNCWVSGQGAGAAAALALHHGVAPRDLKVAELQAELRRQGVEVG
ncbi:MAG: FAD-dependent oxidoreductase [Armatimonadetes bacterium]|nr:FAD-dependent oxidoreductase [Armatimonadota bacterium]